MGLGLNLLQLFLLATAIFPIFIFYFKNFNLLHSEELEKHRKKKTEYIQTLENNESRINNFRVAANVLLISWVATLLFLLIVKLYAVHSSDETLLEYFMVGATYAQFATIFIITSLQFFNWITSNFESLTGGVLKKQGFLDELFLPHSFFDYHVILILAFYVFLVVSSVLSYCCGGLLGVITLTICIALIIPIPVIWFLVSPRSRTNNS